MVQIVLIRPGSTSFDEQGRMKGCLDIPLSDEGERQVQTVAAQLAEHFAKNGTRKLACLYAGPCQSASRTAEIIGEKCSVKRKTISLFENVDHGLWQGKLIGELKRLQPKLYRQIQDSVDSFSPPGGETVQEALDRVRDAIGKLVKRHQGETIGLVLPEPLASIVRQLLTGGEIEDLWKAECDHCRWEWVTLRAEAIVPV